MTISYEDFLRTYKKLASFSYTPFGSKQEFLTIRYTKQRNDEIIHKEMILCKVQGEFYFKEEERSNEISPNTLIDETYKKLTADSLNNEHKHIAALIASIDLEPPKPKLSMVEDFKQAEDSKLKWAIRYFLLDTRLVGGVVGKIIAYAANKENPHYKTIASHILAETLGPLIFPAGLKKPTFIEPGLISIDSILHKQYKAVRNFKPVYEYTTAKGENKRIEFIPSVVEAFSTKKDLASSAPASDTNSLDTITASNELVKANDKNHLHVIYFNGNSGCYQQEYRTVAHDLISYAQKGIPATAVQFNYPGVLSKYKIKQSFELILAGISQVQALRKQGVPLNQITLHGVSLGGCIATLTAYFLYRAKQPIAGVYASRTFASTTQVGRDFFNRALGNNYFSRFLSTLCLPFIHLGTTCSNWYLGTGVFFSLPKYMRNYSVIITPRANREKYKEAHKGTILKRIKYFLLGKEDKPADDAILGRGLHDAWEKKLDAVKTKLKGKAAREEYARENRNKKMLVINYDTGKLETDIDGHAKAHQCYQRPQGPVGSRFNPKKSDGSLPALDPKVSNIGLFHRSQPITKLLPEGKFMHGLLVDGNEAGEVAREWLASAHERAIASGAIASAA